MSAESIGDILRLELRFTSGLLLARVFHRKWSPLVSCKQTHAAFTFTQIESSALCFAHFPAWSEVFFFVTHGRAYTHIKLGWELANIEIKLLMFSSCFLLLLQCNALLSREVSANSADDIISDKSVFLVQVLNTSPYNVYYQWFGPGLRLHLGMARDWVFFWALHKRLTGINLHISGYTSLVLWYLFV